jgi:8-oxo-dGTP pyrophosphatase MutT (NUDIX family)
MLQISIPICTPASSPTRVKAIVSVDNQFLLLRRPCGEWDLPGGRCDDGETLEQTLHRELMEEIGLTPRWPLFIQSGWRERTRKPPVHVAFYGCNMDRQTLVSGLQLSPEHVSAQLISADELAQLTIAPLYAQIAQQWQTMGPISK